MSEGLGKRKRRYAPKTKTGCGTCKKRHIKCGQQRPECANCLSTKLHCEGYGIWGGGTMITKNQHQSSRAMQAAEKSTPSLTSGSPSLSRHNTPIPLHKITHAEQSCFEYFVNRTALKIPGVFYSQFWAPLVLRASASELPILHAAVALGSAHRSAELNLHGSTFPSTSLCGDRNGIPNAHEIFTLKQYNKSIAYLQDLRSEGENAAPQIRIALVACVLYMSLELLRGDYPTAITHTRHGFGLLSKLKRDLDAPAFSPQNSLESVDAFLIQAFTGFDL